MASPVWGAPSSNCKKQYFAWPCKVDQKYGSGYACRDTSRIFKGGELEAFILYDVKEKFTELLTGAKVVVVGRYVRNEDVTMLLGNTRAIPVLKDCYIFSLGFGGYPLEKIDAILGVQE